MLTCSFHSYLLRVKGSIAGVVGLMETLLILNFSVDSVNKVDLERSNYSSTPVQDAEIICTTASKVHSCFGSAPSGNLLMVFRGNDGLTIVTHCNNGKALNSRPSSHVIGYGDQDVYMEVQGFSFTMQLFVLCGTLTKPVNGIIADFVSAASWLPTYFDQLLIITNNCSIYAALIG